MTSPAVVSAPPASPSPPAPREALRARLLAALREAGWPACMAVLFSGLFWLVAAWPATMSTDSLDVWKDVTEGSFYAWHTAAYETFVFVTSLGGRVLGLVAATQTVLLMVGLGALLGAVAPSVPLRTRLWALAALQLVPFVGATAVTLWKDVPFTAFSLWGLAELLRADLFTARRWRRALGLLAAAALFRHDAWLTFAATAALIALFRRSPATFGGARATWLTAGLVLGAGVLSVPVSKLLGAALDARPAPAYMVATNFFADAQFLANKAPRSFSAEDLAVLERVSSGRAREGASWCGNILPYLGGEGFDKDAATREAPHALGLWVRAAMANPGDFAELRMCRVSSLLPAPFGHLPDGAYITHWGIDQPNWASLEPARPVPALTMLAAAWRRVAEYNGPTLFWPGLHFTLMLLAVAWLVGWRGQSPRLWLVVCFGLGRLGVLLAAAPSQDYRYAHAAVLQSLVLLVACAWTLRAPPATLSRPEALS